MPATLTLIHLTLKTMLSHNVYRTLLKHEIWKILERIMAKTSIHGEEMATELLSAQELTSCWQTKTRVNMLNG